MAKLPLNLDAAAIRRLLIAYNAGYYAPAKKSNVEADADAYRLFAGGLARDLPGLVRQLVFLGKDFGGAKVIQFERVSRVIAERILADRGYHDHLATQPSMEHAGLPTAAVQRALAPFVGLPADVGRKRNFAVWASKVLHFSRLEAFPVLDRFAVAALGVRASIAYPAFVAGYRQPFLDALGDLRAAADVDPHSPTLLRRFDKVLYQGGLELYAASRHR